MAAPLVLQGFHRKALSTLPKFGSTDRWQIHIDSLTQWRIINSIDTAPHDFQKMSILVSLTGPAKERSRPYGYLSNTWNQANDWTEYLQALTTIFEPPVESELARSEYRARKQLPREDIGSYLSSKFSLYELAFPVAERSFHSLLDDTINGFYSIVIKREVGRRNPADREALVTCSMTAVANERTAYANGYAESTSMDGLIAASEFNRMNRQEQGAEPMEIDSLNKLERDKTKMKCFHCHKSGHMIKDCRSRLNKLKNNQKSQGYEGKRSFANITCYKCNKKGHIARNCRSTEAVKAAEEVDSKDNLDLDEEEEIALLRN